MLRTLTKFSILFLIATVFFFLAVIGQLSGINASFSDNTFVANKRYLDEQEKLQLSDSFSHPYLATANSGQKSFSEFNEETIDKQGFYLRIDSINLFKAIVPDVDPRYKDVYVESWTKGISHGKFTAKPDQIGITYLFSHAVGNIGNALNENAWFSRMDEVGLGTEVIIYFEGMKYVYEVSEIHEVDPSATGFYTGVAPVPKVRMQFCGPPTGSLAMRTLVDALLVESISL